MAKLYITCKHCIYKKNSNYFNVEYSNIDLEEIPWMKASIFDISTKGVFEYIPEGEDHSDNPKEVYYDEVNEIYYNLKEKGIISNSSYSSDPLYRPYASVIIEFDGQKIPYNQCVLELNITKGFHKIKVIADIVTSKGLERVETTQKMEFLDNNNFLEIYTSMKAFPTKQYYYQDEEGIYREPAVVDKEYHDYFYKDEIRKIKHPEVTINLSSVERMWSYFTKAFVLVNPQLPDNKDDLVPIVKKEEPLDVKTKYLMRLESIDKIFLSLIKPFDTYLLKLRFTDDLNLMFANAMDYLNLYLHKKNQVIENFEYLKREYVDKEDIYIKDGVIIGLKRDFLFPFDDMLKRFKIISNHIKQLLNDYKSLKLNKEEYVRENEILEMAKELVIFFDKVNSMMDRDTLEGIYEPLSIAIDKYRRELFKKRKLSDLEYNMDNFQSDWEKKNRQYNDKRKKEIIKKVNKINKKIFKEEKYPEFVKATKKIFKGKTKKEKKKIELPKINLGFMSTFFEKILKVLGIIGGFFVKLKDWIVDGVSFLWEKICDFFSFLWEKIKDFFSFIWDKITDIRLPRIDIEALFMFLITLVPIIYLVLEYTGVIYKMAFEISLGGSYGYPLTQLIADWLDSNEVDSLLAFLLIIIQIISIVIAAVLEFVIMIVWFVLALVIMILLGIIQIIYLLLLPLAALVVGVMFIISIIKERRAVLTHIICYLLLIVNILCLVHYYYFTLYIANIK